jgi:hypothetical protein
MMAALALSVTMMTAQVKKDFPAHWGNPPEIQTQDYVELPAGYGKGSSTLKHWINANLTKDKARPAGETSAKTPPLYTNNFEQANLGELPEDLKFANGEFAVSEDGGNKFLELPGAPLESFSVQFGPTESENVAVSARIYGTSRGRRYPTFGVGLGGVGGWKLQMAPAKKALELLDDQAVKVSVPYDWKPGEWICLRLQLRKLKDGEWKIEGKAWQHSAAEPNQWTIAAETTDDPVPGAASIFGSPFSGTPIRYDDLMMEPVAVK